MWVYSEIIVTVYLLQKKLDVIYLRYKITLPVSLLELGRGSEFPMTEVKKMCMTMTTIYFLFPIEILKKKIIFFSHH